jgi:peptidoglycan/xylan/chitin deacetylase (PgdA/CDA1 family)
LTLQTLQNAVTAAGEHGGGWLPIGFNDVCNQADASYSACMAGNKPVDSAVFAAFLDWLGAQASEGVTVQTVRQVMGSAQPPLPQRPFAVSLTFDDGLDSQYALREILARHDAKGTFYINSGSVDAGEAGAMTWPEIRDLQAAGHDVGGHTRDHINMLATDTSLEFKTRQTCDDRQRLLEEGINAVSFAYPFGAMDATAQPIVRGCGYQSGRKAGTVTSDGPIYSETIPVTENPYAIRILGFRTGTPGADDEVTLAELQFAVDQAIKYGGSWLPTLFHDVCFPGTASYTTCTSHSRWVGAATIDDFLAWLASDPSRNITVRTVADVMGGGSVAPRVSVTSPANGATVDSGRPQLSGTASGSGPVSVRLYQGDYSTGTPLATLTSAVNGGQWDAQPTAALPDGSYTVQASQVGGNATGTSLPYRFTVDSTPAPTDTTAPVVSVTSPASGATVSTATPTLAGTGGTAAGDESQVTVRVFEGSATTGTPSQTKTVPLASNGSWSVSADALGDGVHTVEASQLDASGNRGTSAPATFTVATTPVDTTAPTVTIAGPADGATVADSTPRVSGTAGTAAGDDDEVSVSVYPASDTSGDVVQVAAAAVGSGGAWSVDLATLADGSYTLLASQTDAAGNTGTSSAVTFTVSTTPTDTTAPTVTITSPAAGSTVRTADVVVSGAAGTAEGDAATVTLRAWSGTGTSGTPAQEVTAAVTATGWSTTLMGLAPGTYTLRATQADASGNVGQSATRTFTKAVGLTVTSLSPGTLGQGAQQATVRVNGTGFNSSTAVSFSGTGVSATVASRTATVVTLRVTVTAGAAIQARTVTAVNSGGARATCTACLSIVAGPKITSVSPTTIRRNTTRTVTVTGSGFRAGQMQVAVSGSGVTVGTVQVSSPTSLTAVLRATATAGLTSRSLTVTDTGTFGRATRASALTVVP